MARHPHASRISLASRYVFWGVCGLLFVFLVAPILVIIPMSFNHWEYFTFPPRDFSLRWYEDLFTNPVWLLAAKNSVIVGVATTILATVLGTTAALGLAQARFRFKAVVMALLISPMIVPIVITAVAVFFFYARLNLVGTYTGLIMAHTALALPFVVITVTATLQGFDMTLARAASSLGAAPVYVFFSVILPLILPGVVSGALFAFATSFDEVVVALFIASPAQRTLPMEIFSGVRQSITPTVTAVASLLIGVSIILMATLELIRRRVASRTIAMPPR
jgi:putative spermidine/putrescine transport system permease protein